ncbi:MAG: segregation/condensation protein A [Planctomycetota bacterium]
MAGDATGSSGRGAGGADYLVRLESFEGPLDLLLHLIRRAEVDLHDIPVASIADQYMASLEDLERVDVELAGEFLVMAATLMEIKSRMIDRELEGEAPASGRERAPKEDEDPRASLVHQLLEYKKYRDAADALESRRATWSRRVPLSPAGVGEAEFRAAMESAGEVEIEDANLLDLVEAFRRVASSVNFDRLGEHEVMTDDTPIELHAEDIVSALREGEVEHGQLPLFGLLRGRSRAEMVGLFLALLNLIRDQRVTVGTNDDRASELDGGFVIELTEQGRDPDYEPPRVD